MSTTPAGSHLTGIYCYPIKGLGGIALREAKLGMRGLAYDRRFMLVNLAGRFLSQRQLPQMAVLDTRLEGDRLVVADRRSPGDRVDFPLEPQDGHSLRVQIWEDSCPAWTISDELDNWFSNALGTACRLVFLPNKSPRRLRMPGATDRHQVSFADGHPYLLTNEASLADLNSRMKRPIGMLRFRPNLVITGLPSYAEDELAEFRIGTARFHLTKPCARCQVTTVDPATGQVDGREPLRTLSTYRRWDRAVWFGLNAGLHPDSEGQLLSVGDPLTVPVNHR